MIRIFLILSLIVTAITINGQQDHYPIKKNGKWGIMNKNGDVVIAPVHEYEIKYINGSKQAFLYRDNDSVYIKDIKGKLIRTFPLDPGQLNAVISSPVRIVDTLTSAEEITFIDSVALSVLRPESGNAFLSLTGPVDILNPKVYIRGLGVLNDIDFNEESCNSYSLYISVEGLYGLTNSCKQIIVEPRYNNAIKIKKGLFVFQSGNFEYLLNIQDKKASFQKYSQINIFRDFLYLGRTKTNVKNDWGFSNIIIKAIYSIAERRIITDFDFKEIKRISKQYFLVKRSDKSFFLNLKGEPIDKISFNHIAQLEQSKGIFKVSNDVLSPFIKFRSNDIIKENISGSKIGLLDDELKLIVPIVYDGIIHGRFFLKDSVYRVFDIKRKAFYKDYRFNNIKKINKDNFILSSKTKKVLVSFKEDGSLNIVDINNFSELEFKLTADAEVKPSRQRKCGINRALRSGKMKYGYYNCEYGFWQVKPEFFYCDPLVKEDSTKENSAFRSVFKFGKRIKDKSKSTSRRTFYKNVFGLFDTTSRSWLVKPMLYGIDELALMNDRPLIRFIKSNGTMGYIISDKGQLKVNMNYTYIGEEKDGLHRFNLKGEVDFDFWKNTGDLAVPFPNNNLTIDTRNVLIQKGRWGYLDTSGKVFIDTIYDMASDFRSGQAIVSHNKKHGVINLLKEQVVASNYDEIQYFDTGDSFLYLLIDKTNKYGLINDKEKSILSMQYFDIMEENEDIYKVKKDRIQYVMENDRMFSDMSFGKGLSYDENHIAVKHGFRWHFLDEYGVLNDEKFTRTYGFSDGSARIKKRYFYGFLDEDYNYIMAPSFTKAGDFNNGVAIAGIGRKTGLITKDSIWIKKLSNKRFEQFDEAGNVLYRNGFKKGLYNPFTKKVLNANYRTIEYDEEFGGYYVRKGRKWGLRDVDGGLILPSRYRSLNKISENKILVMKNSKYLFVSDKGKKAVPGKYSKARSFSEGLAAVEKQRNGLGRPFRGYIDSTGSFIIKGKYTKWYDFKNGRALVKEGPFYKIIDRQGNIVCSSRKRINRHFDHFFIVGNKKVFNQHALFINEYDKVKLLNDSIMLVKGVNGYGILNKYGREVLEPVYDRIKIFKDNTYKVNSNLYGLANSNGEIYSEPAYVHIEKSDNDKILLKRWGNYEYIKPNGALIYR